MKPVGHVDDATRLSVSGWAADADNLRDAVRVIITVNGTECGSTEADQFRADLQTISAGATGRYAFRFYFPEPLSPYRRQQVLVRVDGSETPLPFAMSVLAAVERDPDDAIHRPHGPVLLSTMGRSGSTALMASLAHHPQIVVAGQRPFEIEMACYYAYALRTLIAAGDHERSLRPDQITASANLFQIGFNPYFEPSFRGIFRDPSRMDHFLTGVVPNRLGSAFKEIVLDFYEAVARDQNRKHPIYFAEKLLPEDDARIGARFIFPNAKEIALVRDVRDVICSFMQWGGFRFEVILEDITSSSNRLVQIKESSDDSVHFIRYEDFILRQQDTLAGIFRFLGISPISQVEESIMAELFEVHATSRDPAASIGRWRKDLTNGQIRHCERFSAFLEAFGYEPPPSGSRAQVARRSAKTGWDQS